MLVHTPHRDKAAGTRKTIELVEASGIAPEMVVIDHNNELTVHEVLASGCWAGFSIYPGTKMDEHRMVRVLEEHGPERLIVNSACDWGVSDPLKVRKTADAMKAAGFDDDVIDQVVWRNPVEFFAQSGRLILDDLAEPDLTATFEGSRRAARREGVRLRHADGSLLHLAYCSNVHPADDLDGVAAQLERYTARVRERLDVPMLGIGLWVAAPALADEAAADRLAEQLERLSLEVVTLNGFPYKAFHAPVVKRDVYWPHWAQDDRRDYTLGLARLLARLLPDDVEEGSISTLPLGWREGWDDAAQDAALRALADLAVELEELHARDRQADPARAGARARLHGRDDRPGRATRSAGSRRSGSASASTPATSRCSSRSPVGGGRAAAASRACRSSRPRSRRALRVPEPGSAEGRELLARFDEPKFLHQVRECVNSHVEGTDDLPEALGGGLPARARVARALPRAGQHGRAHDAGRAERDAGRAGRRRGAVDAALRGRDLHVERHARRPARTTKGWSPGWPANWNGRATGWSRWERRSWHDVGGHRCGGAHPARAEAHAAGRRSWAPTASTRRWTRSSPRSPARSRRRSLTGLTPTDHGIVGNGWYFRDLGEVFLWRQHNKLVQGEKVWETARRAKPGYRAANLCWWYAMGASTDLTVTPRPIYHADGRKSPDAYTYPPQLHDNLTGPLGEFPLFQYWGPTANIKSTKWIADAAKIVLDNEQLDLLLVYLPHLDYDHQRFGPEGPEARQGRAGARRGRSAT